MNILNRNLPIFFLSFYSSLTVQAVPPDVGQTSQQAPKFSRTGRLLKFSAVKKESIETEQFFTESDSGLNIESQDENHSDSSVQSPKRRRKLYREDIIFVNAWPFIYKSNGLYYCLDCEKSGYSGTKHPGWLSNHLKKAHGTRVSSDQIDHYMRRCENLGQVEWQLRFNTLHPLRHKDEKKLRATTEESSDDEDDLTSSSEGVLKKKQSTLFSPPQFNDSFKGQEYISQAERETSHLPVSKKEKGEDEALEDDRGKRDSLNPMLVDPIFLEPQQSWEDDPLFKFENDGLESSTFAGSPNWSRDFLELFGDFSSDGMLSPTTLDLSLASDSQSPLLSLNSVDSPTDHLRHSVSPKRPILKKTKKRREKEEADPMRPPNTSDENHLDPTSYQLKDEVAKFFEQNLSLDSSVLSRPLGDIDYHVLFRKMNAELKKSSSHGYLHHSTLSINFFTDPSPIVNEIVHAFSRGAPTASFVFGDENYWFALAFDLNKRAFLIYPARSTHLQVRSDLLFACLNQALSHRNLSHLGPYQLTEIRPNLAPSLKSSQQSLIIASLFAFHIAQQGVVRQSVHQVIAELLRGGFISYPDFFAMPFPTAALNYVDSFDHFVKTIREETYAQLLQIQRAPLTHY